MKLNPHLNFKGNCAAAFRFYEQKLGGKLLFSITYGSSPMAKEFPPESADAIMHATIEIGGVIVMGADSPAGYYQSPAGFCVSLSVDDPDEAGHLFNALAEGGKVNMPLQQTFWAKRFGMVTDQFDIPWMINCNDAPAEG